MKWVLIASRHVNTDNIDGFYWKKGVLNIYFSDNDAVTCFNDPDRELYVKMCHQMGVRPCEEVEHGQK
jgi:hypothetical protein